MTQDNEMDHKMTDRRASSNMDTTPQGDEIDSEDKLSAMEDEGNLSEDTSSELLDEFREKADRFENNWKRSVADLQNYKRRAESERTLQAQASQIALVINLLPICDDFGRALEGTRNENTGTGWFEGFEAIQRKLNSLLESMGLTEIPALGEPFDPECHEALASQPGPENTCVEVILRGFKLGDRVVRPAQVIVGEGMNASSDEQKEK